MLFHLLLYIAYFDRCLFDIWCYFCVITHLLNIFRSNIHGLKYNTYKHCILYVISRNCLYNNTYYPSIGVICDFWADLIELMKIVYLESRENFYFIITFTTFDWYILCSMAYNCLKLYITSIWCYSIFTNFWKIPYVLLQCHQYSKSSSVCFAIIYIFNKNVLFLT